MRLTFPVLLLILFLALQSCISRKQMTYLQETENGKDSLNYVTPVMNRPYKVQVNDILSITMKSDLPELVAIFEKNIQQTQGNNISDATFYLNGYTVDVHGNILIPRIGEVNVLGYTLEQIKEQLKTIILDRFLTEDANLFISVKMAGISYTVSGEVGSPGRNTMYVEKLNIIEALANSGEVNITGDKKDIVLVRQYPEGKRIYHLDVTNAEVMNSPYFYIMPNDMIIVNPLPQKSLGTGTNGLQTFTTIFSVFSVITSTVLLIRSL